MFKETGEMTMTATNIVISILIGYVLGMFIIGIQMGRKSLKMWKKAEKDFPCGCTGGFWGYVLFPLSAVERSLGKTAMRPLGIEEYYKNFQNGAEYISLTALLWPFRVGFNLLFLIAIGVMRFGNFLVVCLSKMIKE